MRKRFPRELMERVDRDIEAGEIRTEISCEEARREWFVTARTMYVEGGEPRYPIDFEVGAHIALCPTTECRRLLETYSEVLRTSRGDDADRLAAYLDDLEQELGTAS